jgi:TPR repeat protein
MWRAGILLLLAVSAAAQDVEELKKLAPAFDTAKGEGPKSFRVDVRADIGVFRVAYDHGRGSLVVWNRFDGCPLLVACGQRVIFYDVLGDKLWVLEGVGFFFEFLQEGGRLNLNWGAAEAPDGSRVEIRVDVGSILARCRRVRAEDVGNGTWKLTGRSERRHLFAAWIDPKAPLAFRRMALVMHGPVSLQREPDRVDVAFGEAAPGDFPKLPDSKTLARDFTVECLRIPDDQQSRKELMGRMVSAALLAPGVVRADARAKVQAAFGSPVVWEELEKPYAKARKALIARFGRGPLAGHYERAKDAFDADRYEEAQRGFEQALKDGDTRALTYLGFLAVRDEDADQAEHYLRLAGEEEYPEAQFTLGVFLENVKEDLEQAATWYRRAAESGHVEAAGRLGDAYRRGGGVPKDIQKAVHWYTVAAEGGEAVAQHMLAVLLLYGNGVSQDETTAVAWLTKAAEQGHVESQMLLGLCHYSGRGGPADPEKAAFRLRQAAEQGNAPAQRFLGRMYLDGDGVEKDPDAGVSWLEAAAKQGLAEACVDLAEVYDEGERVTRNPVRAHALFTIGGKADEAARLAKELTPEQLEESARVQKLFRPGK